MDSLWNFVRVVIAAAIIVAVAELSKRFPRYGALLLSLPLMSILAFAFSWRQHHDLAVISKLAKETLILVPLGLPFFVPLMFATQMGWSFWPAFGGGILLATLTIGLWLILNS
jgi:predicted ABC-type exoprotein transport system permease subunit